MTAAPTKAQPVAIATGRGVTAVLGPTNTGKTHLAIERMMGHETGMIGLPLRLLAREVYDRVVAHKGPAAVALITGEEKIVPRSPRYYVSTVEAMPLDIAVDFLAIDEIQLAADSERGHVFTQRLLAARGRTETMLLGAANMQVTLQTLLPGSNFVSRPRFSNLSFAGMKKITRLPRRSAIVAFSADRVYAIAELIRRQRGGAAVVLGALSPRTRNAQVALYEAGDVDFLVATDAIGMGLNMDVDHVAFSGRKKFDGQRHRALNAAEIAQIAGRAGRHMNDGTFGLTDNCEEFDAEMVERIENHRFDPLKTLVWRNTDLDFTSLDALLASLSVHPRHDSLTRTRRGDDFMVLEHFMRGDGLAGRQLGRAAVATLWEACQIPDYRKIGLGDHAGLILKVFDNLMSDEGVVPEDWLASQVALADRTDGDLDALSNRLAHVRTWTFVANRPHWLGDARHWQERTRAIEDTLSDALHERLIQKFIDRRTSVLMKKMKEKDTLQAGVTDGGDVVVEGEFVGKLDGFRFALDTAASSGTDAKTLQAAAMSMLGSELSARASALAAEDDAVFAATETGYVTWRGVTVARLEGGDSALKPQLKLLADEQMAAPDREAVRDRLGRWVDAHIQSVLAPLFALQGDDEVTGLARGVAFRLTESLGLMAREPVAGDIQQLDQTARALLRRHGVRFGAFSIYIPAFLKPQPAALRLLLFKLWREASEGHDREDWPTPPVAGLTSLNVGAEAPAAFYEAVGYRICGPRAVRADMAERLADSIRPLINWKPAKEGDQRPDGAHPSGGFTVTPGMMSLVGCSGDDFAAILRALGHRCQMVPLPKTVLSVAPTVQDTSPKGEPAPAADTVPVGAVPDAVVQDNAPVEAVAETPAEHAPAVEAAPDESATEPVTAQLVSDSGPDSGDDPSPDAAHADVNETAADETAVSQTAAAVAAIDGAAAGISEPPDEGSDAKDEEPTEIAVWRPKPRRQPGRPPRGRGAGQRGRVNRGDGAGVDRTAGEGSQGRRGQPARDGRGKGSNDASDKPRRRGKPPANRDPRPPRPKSAPSRPMAPEDSPFAALQALKEKLEQDPDKTTT